MGFLLLGDNSVGIILHPKSSKHFGDDSIKDDIKTSFPFFRKFSINSYLKERKPPILFDKNKIFILF